MSLQENIKNIIFYYIKKKYNEHLETENLKFISDYQLQDLVDNLYTKEKESLQKYIRNCLKDMYQDNYNSALVENIIYEIFDDEELAKNRVILEIKSFQEHQKNKNNIYEVVLKPDKQYGIGLKLDFEPHDIIISNFKRNPEDKSKLPAEDTQISIGDSIIGINGISLEDKDSDDCISIFKDNMTKDIVSLKLKTYTQTNQLEVCSLNP